MAPPSSSLPQEVIHFTSPSLPSEDALRLKARPFLPLFFPNYTSPSLPPFTFLPHSFAEEIRGFPLITFEKSPCPSPFPKPQTTIPSPPSAQKTNEFRFFLVGTWICSPSFCNLGLASPTSSLPQRLDFFVSPSRMSLPSSFFSALSFKAFSSLAGAVTSLFCPPPQLDEAHSISPEQSFLISLPL